jgi:hypothetical protein
MNGDLKHSCGREAYNTWFTMKERIGTARFGLGIGKLKGAKGDTGRDRCLHSAGEESEFHLLLKCPETQEVEGGAPEQ